MGLIVLDPVYREERERHRLARALPSLEGRTVGLLDNGKRNSDRLLDFVEEALRRDYGVREVVRVRKRDPSRPASPEVMASLQRCDALFTGVGD